jgi:hypothetical protein
MEYDALTQAVMNAYETFVYAVTGVYFSMQAPGAERSPRLVREFDHVANRLLHSFMQDAAEALSSFQSEGVEAIVGDVFRVARSNVDTLHARLQGRHLAFQSMLKDATGAVGQLLQRKLERPIFKTVDASGRTWDSSKLLRVMVRDYGYRATIERNLDRMPGDLAVVTYADPAHANNGLVFSKSGDTPGYPSFAQIRSKIFHPNATAQVTEHVSP